MADVGPGTQLGRYTLEQSIAKGGFGQVFRARQAGPGGFAKTVAIKVLGTEALRTDRGLEVFRREARVAAGLTHRNIVQVHEVGEQAGAHYLVMELVDGLNLRQLHACWGDELPLWLRVGVVLEVCRGLAYAHGARRRDGPIVHRDVKPSNILVSLQGDVKLTDFGLAKPFRAEQDLTVSGAVKGTPAYMSPEQQAGSEVTTASDIFSLGMVLFRISRAADGRPPAPLAELIAATMQPLAEQRPDATRVAEQLAAMIERIAAPGNVARIGDELGRWVGRARLRLEGQAGGSGGETLDLPANGPAAGRGPGPAAAGFAPELIVPADPADDEDQPTLARRATRPWVTRRRLALAGTLTLLLAGGAAAAWLVTRGEQLVVATAIDAGRPTLDTLRLPSVQPLDAASAEASPRPDATDRSPADADNPTPTDVGSTNRASRPDSRAPAKRPPRPTGRGFLSVDTRPWSRVYVDGRRVGITPIWRLRLRAGWRRVRLVGQQRRRAARRVRIRRGRHTNLGMIRLR